MTARDDKRESMTPAEMAHFMAGLFAKCHELEFNGQTLDKMLDVEGYLRDQAALACAPSHVGQNEQRASSGREAEGESHAGSSPAGVHQTTPSTTAPKHLQDAPRVRRNMFTVPNPDPQAKPKEIEVVFASFAACIERETNTCALSATACSADTARLDWLQSQLKKGWGDGFAMHPLDGGALYPRPWRKALESVKQTP